MTCYDVRGICRCVKDITPHAASEVVYKVLDGEREYICSLNDPERHCGSKMLPGQKECLIQCIH